MIAIYATRIRSKSQRAEKCRKRKEKGERATQFVSALISTASLFCTLAMMREGLPTMMPFMPIMSLSDAESQQCVVIADKQSAENRRVRGDESGGTVSADGEHGGGIALGVQ